MNAARRIAALDAARGAALGAMFVYHFTWDLAHFELIDRAAPYAAPMRFFSHAIAFAFLFIAGVSLALARPRAARAFWRRAAVVGGAAALVTGASVVFAPNAPILFGILHAIALASVIALPFLAAPWPAAACAALVVALAPAAFSSPTFDPPALAWLGFGAHDPHTMDFRPLFPWAAPLLAGVAFGLSPVGAAVAARLAPWRGTSRVSRLAQWGGRRSLLIYLTHQPLFFLLLTAYVALARPVPPADEATFRKECARECASTGAPARVCADSCGCVSAQMKRLNLWPRLVSNTLDAPETAILAQVSRDCARR